MSYCVVSDVRAIVDTDVTDAEIDDLIDECGAFITAKIGSTANPQILRGINRTWVAYRCMLKDPNTEALGEYRGDRTETLRHLKELLDEMWKIGGGGIATSYSYEALPTTL